MSRHEPRAVPPGQRLVAQLPVQHYGRVPTFDPTRWNLTLTGETEGETRVVTWDELLSLPRKTVVADMHCVSKLTEQDIEWSGVPVSAVIELGPPRSQVEHTLVSAEYGYATSVRLSDLLSPRALLATHRGGSPLSPERGGPVRLVLPHLYAWKGPKWVREIAYVCGPERGFWEQRGYHLVGDAWRQERYSYQS